MLFEWGLCAKETEGNCLNAINLNTLQLQLSHKTTLASSNVQLNLPESTLPSSASLAMLTDCTEDYDKV